jgi:hypothetical protein
VLDRLVPAHADAVVRDGDPARLLVDFDADREVGAALEQFGLADGLETQFEYSEWIISCSSCLTSAWKPRVSLVLDSVVLIYRSCVELGFASLALTA